KVPSSRRSYELRWKKTVPEWTVTNGDPGVAVSLGRDSTALRNVVYAHGVGPDGYQWANTKYPNLHADAAPLYTGTLMSLGSTDANSNGGVSLWQQRAKDLGYKIPVDGTLNLADIAIVRTVQRRFGVSVDGVIGPQTW